jgi:hypothetical protein
MARSPRNWCERFNEDRLRDGTLFLPEARIIWEERVPAEGGDLEIAAP